MLARIYQPAKTAMQSGRANTHEWVLEFEQGLVAPEALMGWQAVADPSGHHRIHFDTKEQAIDFARRYGIPHQVVEPQEPKRILKAYADNFSSRRKEPWSH
jgi:hypothetical protein